MTAKEKRKAARESLQKQISEDMSEYMNFELLPSDENEELQYTEKDLAGLVIEVLQQDYHIGGDNGRRKERSAGIGE